MNTHRCSRRVLLTVSGSDCSRTLSPACPSINSGNRERRALLSSHPRARCLDASFSASAPPDPRPQLYSTPRMFPDTTGPPSSSPSPGLSAPTSPGKDPGKQNTDPARCKSAIMFSATAGRACFPDSIPSSSFPTRSRLTLTWRLWCTRLLLAASMMVSSSSKSSRTAKRMALSTLRGSSWKVTWGSTGVTILRCTDKSPSPLPVQSSILPLRTL
mmetsp:Transcript_37486/g.78534  ORF Transcript_37486/g.78534 Transcript_37486/m.78534 type:complete len:215 (+) Transcript_37486:839-1483(+)